MPACPFPAQRQPGRRAIDARRHGQAAAVFDAGGLRIDAAQQSQRDVNTGQSQTFRITAASFQGEALCGPGGTLGRYLHPDNARLATRPYYCLSPVLPVGPDSVLMFFRDSNETFLAGLTARGGRLRVERLRLSEDEARDTVETRKLLDARMPGWSRVQTDWTETALVRHDSCRSCAWARACCSTSTATPPS